MAEYEYEEHGTVGTHRATAPYPPQFAVRFVVWLAVFASQVGVWVTLLFVAGGRWYVEALAAVLAFVGLVIAARQSVRGLVMGRSLWIICENTFGPVAKDGATVIVRPSGRPEAPGEVVVEYPDSPGVS